MRMGQARITFTVGVSDSGLPAVYRTEVRVVEECPSVEQATEAARRWRDASLAVESEMATRVQP